MRKKEEKAIEKERKERGAAQKVREASHDCAESVTRRAWSGVERIHRVLLRA